MKKILLFFEGDNRGSVNMLTTPQFCQKQLTANAKMLITVNSLNLSQITVENSLQFKQLTTL